jgi:hypothetical protein
MSGSMRHAPGLVSRIRFGPESVTTIFLAIVFTWGYIELAKDRNERRGDDEDLSRRRRFARVMDTQDG